MFPGIYPVPLVAGRSDGSDVPEIDWGDVHDIRNAYAIAHTTEAHVIPTALDMSVQVDLGSLVSSNTSYDLMGVVRNGVVLGGGGYGPVTPIAIGRFDFHANPGDSVAFIFQGQNFDGIHPWYYDMDVNVKYKSPGSSTYDQTLDSFHVAIGTMDAP